MIKECDSYLNITKSESIEEFKKIYNTIIYLEKIEGKIKCWCSQNIKKGICVHKYALKLVNGEMKNIIKLQPKQTGAKRRVSKGGWNIEETEKKCKKLKK